MTFTLGSFAAATAAIALGAILQASTGFGAGLVIVPLLSLISLQLVPGPVLLASLTLSVIMTVQGRRHIKFRNMGSLMAGLASGMILGTASLSLIPLALAGVASGVIVLLAVGISARGHRIPFTPLHAAMAGVLSGFMGVVAAIGAPVLALLYQHEEGPSLRATLAFVFLVSTFLMLGFLSMAGRFGADEARLGLYLLPGFVIGFFLGGPLARMMDRGYARAAILLISTLSAIFLIAKSVARL